jgi:hypothetical protein
VAGRLVEAVDGVPVAAPRPDVLGVRAVTALTGDVQRWDCDQRRWVTVLAASSVRVTDRRQASRLFERTDAFGRGDYRGRPVPPPPAHDHVHVRRWS